MRGGRNVNKQILLHQIMYLETYKDNSRWQGRVLGGGFLRAVVTAPDDSGVIWLIRKGSDSFSTHHTSDSQTQALCQLR